MIRLRVVFMVEEEEVPQYVKDFLSDGAVAIEINYDPGEP